MMRRYLTVVGIIVVVLVGLAIWQKPPLENMRKSVETALAEYGRERGVPVVSEVESNDWIVAASHRVKLAGGETFSCFGAYHVTVCQSPD
jgi:hypothetical protein